MDQDRINKENTLDSDTSNQSDDDQSKTEENSNEGPISISEESSEDGDSEDAEVIDSDDSEDSVSLDNENSQDDSPNNSLVEDYTPLDTMRESYKGLSSNAKSGKTDAADADDDSKDNSDDKDDDSKDSDSDNKDNESENTDNLDTDNMNQDENDGLSDSKESETDQDSSTDSIETTYTEALEIASEMNESKDDDEEKLAADVKKWTDRKTRFGKYRDKIKNVAVDLPATKTLITSIDAIYNILSLLMSNATRKRMAENRRKFKKKYENKQDGKENLVEQSKGLSSKVKRLVGAKKTDTTVNKELLEEKYKDTKTDDPLRNDARQFLIDDKLMNINKKRQSKETLKTVWSGFMLPFNVMKDVESIANLGIFDAVKFAAKRTVKASAKKTGSNDLKDKYIDKIKDKMKSKKGKEESEELTGMLLEHIGAMSPLEDKQQVLSEYEHVESEIDATGVDRMQLYKSNGSPDIQKKLLIDALA